MAPLYASMAANVWLSRRRCSARQRASYERWRRRIDDRAPDGHGEQRDDENRPGHAPKSSRPEPVPAGFNLI
jgi:hypothetical protein